MNEMESSVPPIEEGLFIQPASGEPPRLLGGYCPECELYFFPRPDWCRSCLNPVGEADLGSDGRLYSYTIVRTRPPFGLPKPYGLGYVDLNGCGLRVFSLLDPEAIDRFQLDQPLRLVLGVLGHDGRGREVIRPFFTPIDRDGS